MSKDRKTNSSTKKAFIRLRPIDLFKRQYGDILFWLLYPSTIFLNGAFIGTFCRRQKCPKTPLQIYEAIFATQNRLTPCLPSAYHALAICPPWGTILERSDKIGGELLLNRFAFKDRIASLQIIHL